MSVGVLENVEFTEKVQIGLMLWNCAADFIIPISDIFLCHFYIVLIAYKLQITLDIFIE